MSFTRHDVFVDSGDLADQSDETWDALVDWGNRHDPPRVLVKDGLLVRVTDRDLEAYDRYSLREESSRAAKFLKTLANGNPSPQYPPLEIVDSLLRRDPRVYTDAPRITAVVDVPVVSPAGKIVMDPGLHEESGLYFKPAAGTWDSQDYVFGFDTVDDVSAARDLLLNDLLGDFDFVDDASRANALGLVLLPFVRHFIGDDPTPLHAVLAPQPGSGKTYLVQACLIPGCGLAGMAPAPRDTDELRKLITSSLLSAKPALVFDNIPTHLASGTLASALTSRVWNDRILGQSKEVDLPVRCVWATTGNNMTAASELVDRVCPILLDPRGKPARHRKASTFKHSDLHGWALRNRAKLVGAALTLVMHWLEGAAQLTPDGTFVRHDYRHLSAASLGSFERWADTIGGILAAADVGDFLGNLDSARELMDMEHVETVEFLAAWYAISGEQLLTREQVVSMCQPGGPLYVHLPPVVDRRDVGLSVRRWLTGHRGQTQGGFALVGVDPQPLRWCVRQTG